jgi:hypothetical protein
MIRNIFEDIIYDIYDEQRKSTLKIRKELKKLKNEKINIVFVCHRPPVWGSLKTVFEACNTDEKFNVTIVAIPNKKQLPKLELNHEIYESEGAEEFFKDYPCNVINGYDYETKTWYDLKKLEPDYLFFQTQYNICRPSQYNSKIVSQYTSLCYVHYSSFASTNLLSSTHQKGFMSYAYMIFCYSESYRKNLLKLLSDYGKNSDLRLYMTGFPGYDDLNKYKNMESSIWGFPRENKKLRILWTPRWSTSEGTCSFFNYKDKFIEYADTNSDIDFVFRPHPQGFKDFISTGEMTEYEVEYYKNEYAKRENMNIDFNKEYYALIYSSDVLIADFSGFIGDYFISGKPIIYCHKVNIFDEFINGISEGFYWAYNWNDVTNFLKEIKLGNDPLKKRREELIENNFHISADGAGKAIKEIIKADFYGTV